MVNEEKLKELRQISQDYSKRIEEMKTELEVAQKANVEKLAEISDKMRVKIDQDNFMPFLNKPYVLIPTGKHEEWYVPVPKFIRMNLGWLDFSTDTYNIFKINKYMNWLGELPAELEGKFKDKMKLPLQVFDGMLLTGKEHQEDAWNKFGKFLSRREGADKIKIKKGYEFQLLAELIDNGILPFMKQPVQAEDLLERPVKFTLRDYQKEAWDKFLETGATGVFWAFSAGKTFFGLKALSSIKGNKLIVVPTVTLVEQWTERMREYTDLKEGETSIVTYHSFDKVRDKEWSLVIFDEVHHLPANQFSRFATLNTKYRIGLCLHKRTTVTLEDGNVMKISEIVDNKLPVKVLSYNHGTGQIEAKPILDYYKREVNEILKVKIKTKFGIKEILCSPEHTFFVSGKYKKASELIEGDETMILVHPHCTLNNPVVFMRIESGIVIGIEKVGVRKDNRTFYDLEIADNHNFFAHKVLTHNSGSPFREDQRENYIFALTGFPIGISWDSLIEEGIIEAPDVILYILSDYKAKESKLAELLQQEKKTIVFCDKINLGKSLSKKFEIPFVYGQTKDRLDIINKSDMTIVSRVGDEGLSLPDIERVIEIDFLFGSRRQEGQRMGRLFHGEKKGEHIILMTEKEYEEYGKRLFAITERGFKIEVRR